MRGILADGRKELRERAVFAEQREDAPFGFGFLKGREVVPVLVAQAEPIEVLDLVAELSTPTQKWHVRGIVPRRRPRDHLLERRSLLRPLAELRDFVTDTAPLEQGRDQRRVIVRRVCLRPKNGPFFDKWRDQEGRHPATVAIELEALFQNFRPCARGPRCNGRGRGYVIEGPNGFVDGDDEESLIPGRGVGDEAGIDALQ